ncbi:MAG: hypothetical protein NTZ44_01385 [Candidatus Nomurabacteria bacterium]|nr:hypothetical protein [Candidatus Nomurabacteria bacterium]
MESLQILSSIFLLANKYFWLKRKPSGWIHGIIGMIILTVCLYIQMVFKNESNLWIMIVSNLTAIPVMMYGYLIAVTKNGSRFENLLNRWNLTFKIIVIVLTFFVCILILIEAITTSLLIIQFILTSMASIGTLLLAFNKRFTNMSGWILFLLTHILSAYTMFEVHASVLAWCQVISCFFALVGVYQEAKNKNLEVQLPDNCSL